MSPYQSEATSLSSRGNSLPALPQFKTVFDWNADPFNEGVGGILDDTIGLSWSWFQLLNQSSSAELPGSMEKIVLIPGVCGDDSSAIRNCSDLCSRRSDMFGSWRTLWHCLSLASLSIADTSFPGLNESSRDLIHTALGNFSITSTAGFPGEMVLNNTFECALASCNADKGECNVKDLNTSYIVNGSVQLNVLHDSVMELCEGLEVEMDADIAGPGVVISYIFQAAMAVFAWACIVLPHAAFLVPSKIKIPISTLCSKILSFISRSSLLRGVLMNLTPATSTFLVEFHEAQCFFATSVQIALLYAKLHVLSSKPDNWEALYQFRALIQLVGSTCAWPVILTHIALREAQLDSLYYLTLSIVALISATVTVATTIDPDVDETYRLFKGLNNIPECGGNTSLRSFCLQRSRLISSLLDSRFIYICSPMIILFCLSKFLKVTLGQVFGTLVDRRHRDTTFLSTLAFPLAGTIIGFNFYIIAFLISSLISIGELQNRVGADEWGVGQVIAVLIWAPVLSKYFYLIICGIEKGFFYRLSRAFMVVKRPSETENDEEGGNAPGDQGDVAPGDDEGVAQADEGVFAPGHEEDTALSDERDIALGDATGTDTVPLLPVHRNTVKW